MAEHRLRVSLDSLVAVYAARNRRSRAIFERAQQSLPGGNTRSGVYFDPFPLYAECGEGVYLIDVDGHRLLDFVANNSSLILGHAHPLVVTALQEQVAKGTGFSRPTVLEVELAEELRERVPSLERLRFCNSGTEAVLHALRAARAFTGRRKIAKFEGAYHGGSDYALVSHTPPTGPEAGPIRRPRAIPSSAGLSAAVDEVVILPFNDEPACREIINEQADELAAVIVDPLMTGAGVILPADGFLARLREITERAGVLLIFDEVISLRIGRGGAQEHYGVRPDLTALGKIIAGGTPGGAFGGRGDIMALYDPTTSRSRIPHAGTYNANPLTMVAGATTLRALTPEAYTRLNSLTSQLSAALAAAFEEAGVQAQVTAIGSIFRVHFMPALPRHYREAATDDKVMQKKLFFWLLNHGILWTNGGYVSLPMEPEHIDFLVSTVRTALQQL